MRIELEQRLAQEYLYAAGKMQEAAPLPKKMFYFSVLFSEAQRILNLDWDRDLALIFAVSNHTYTQVNASLQTASTNLLTINWETVFNKLAQATSAIASYYGMPEKQRSKEALLDILGELSEVTYAISGNGSYLVEKGMLRL